MSQRIGRKGQCLVVTPEAAERIDLRINCNRRVGKIGICFRKFYCFVEWSQRLLVPAQLDQAGESADP